MKGSERIDTHELWSAVYYTRRAAEMMRLRGGVDNYEQGREMEGVANRAEVALRKIDKKLPGLLRLQEAADRSYDRYVLDGPSECCSCHIIAPCDFCISRSSDDDDEHASLSKEREGA